MQVKALHPAHTAASVAAALPRLHYYEEGSCAVHHMFGAQVTERVRAAHGDALLTAHFEVRCMASSQCLRYIWQGRSCYLSIKAYMARA